MKVNAGQAPSTLIPEYIGSDFDKVITVADNMETVTEVVNNLDHIKFIEENIIDVANVGANIEDVVNVSTNMNYVKDVSQGIEGLPVISYIGDEPPTQPLNGAEWFCTKDGRTYTWYEDVDSGQWVESSPQSVVGVSNTFALWKRSLAETGYDLIGSFQDGCTVTSVDQVVLDTDASVVYQWKGTIPAEGKVISSHSTPATTGGISPAAWVDKTNEALLDNLAKSSGAMLIGGLPLVSPVHFNAQPGALLDATSAIKSAIAKSVATGWPLDLRGGPWLFSETLDFTGVKSIVSDFSGRLICNPVGFIGGNSSYGKWAVTFGKPVGGFSANRNDGCVIAGSLVVESISRTAELDGVFLKGSWFNVGHIRAYNFNGHGVYRDSVWDSTFQRISVELCGNVTKYAYWHSSVGDTANASNLVSLQVEQAYHKGFYIDAIRDVVSNVHAERLYQLTTNDGSANIDGSTWLNSHIVLSNAKLVQVICDCATANPPTGETIVAGQKYKLRLNGVDLSVDSIIVDGAVYTDYGDAITATGLKCTDYLSRAPANDITLICPNIVTVSAESRLTVLGGNIYNLRAQYNANNQSYFNVAIDNIEFTQNLAGDIDFKSCSIRLVTDTKVASNAAKAPVEFYGCTIQEFKGAYNSRANIHGGYIHLFSAVSQSLAHCFNVKFGTFSPTGNSGYLTRGCTANTVSSWTYPLHVSYSAGTLTERVGYDAAGKLYQNTDGVLSWTKLA